MDPGPLPDNAPLEQHFAHHAPALRSMLQRRIDPRLGARLDADDVLQETFLVAQRKWPGFAASGLTLYAWLYRVARDCLIEAWRRETRDKRNAQHEMPWPEASSVQLGLGLVSPGTGPRSAAARAEQEGQVRQAMEMLSADDREILWMRHFDELSFAEIAAVLGVTENTATVRELRARRRLKDLWKTIHPDDDP